MHPVHVHYYLLCPHSKIFHQDEQVFEHRLLVQTFLFGRNVLPSDEFLFEKFVRDEMRPDVAAIKMECL